MLQGAGSCRAAWGTQRPPRGSRIGNGSGDKLFYLQSGSGFDWEPCEAWSRRETGRQVTSWLRCFLKRAQLKIPEGFLRPGACAWGPAVSCPAPATVCLHRAGGGSLRSRKAAGGELEPGSRAECGKANRREEKTRVPCLGRSGARLHHFQMLCSLPLGSFSLRKQSNHFSKKLSSDPEKKHFLLWKSPW